jgi:haloalkane dehalogenase
MEVLRTPEDRFAGLPGFPYAARTMEWEGLRLAHVDEGEGPPVVLLHGQPTWSFLFRSTIARLVERGFRAIAPDLPGFGRSDKPADQAWYSFARHVDSLRALLEALDLRDVTLVMHDWGGAMGVRLAAVEAPERIARLVALDTSVVAGRELGEEWQWFADLVAARDVFPVGRIVRMGCAERPSRAVVAAYDAPFPDERHKAGVRAFPDLVPVPGETVTRPQMDEAVAALRGDRRPALLLWGEADPIFPVARHGPELEEVLPQAGPVRVLPGTGHFLPEERGAELADAVAALISGR